MFQCWLGQGRCGGGGGLCVVEGLRMAMRWAGGRLQERDVVKAGCWGHKAEGASRGGCGGD